MRNKQQILQGSCSEQDVCSAWIVAAATLCALLSISTVQDSDTPIERRDMGIERNSELEIDVLFDSAEPGAFEVGSAGLRRPSRPEPRWA